MISHLSKFSPHPKRAITQWQKYLSPTSSSGSVLFSGWGWARGWRVATNTFKSERPSLKLECIVSLLPDLFDISQRKQPSGSNICFPSQIMEQRLFSLCHCEANSYTAAWSPMKYNFSFLRLLSTSKRETAQWILPPIMEHILHRRQTSGRNICLPSQVMIQCYFHFALWGRHFDSGVIYLKGGLYGFSFNRVNLTLD